MENLGSLNGSWGSQMKDLGKFLSGSNVSFWEDIGIGVMATTSAQKNEMSKKSRDPRYSNPHGIYY